MTEENKIETIELLETAISEALAIPVPEQVEEQSRYYANIGFIRNLTNTFPKGKNVSRKLVPALDSDGKPKFNKGIDIMVKEPDSKVRFWSKDGLITAKLNAEKSQEEIQAFNDVVSKPKRNRNDLV